MYKGLTPARREGGRDYQMTGGSLKDNGRKMGYTAGGSFPSRGARKAVVPLALEGRWEKTYEKKAQKPNSKPNKKGNYIKEREQVDADGILQRGCKPTTIQELGGDRDGHEDLHFEFRVGEVI